MLDILTDPIVIFSLVVGAAIAFFLGLRLAKHPEEGIVLLAFFLPFERIPSLDFAGFTFKINHFIGGLTCLFWLLAVLLARRKIAPNPLTIPITLLLFCFILSGVNAVDQFRQLTVFVSMVIMVVLYTTTVNTLTNKRTLQSAVAALFLAAGIMSLIALYQFFGDLAGLSTGVTGLDPGYTKVVFGFPRPHAFSKEPLYFANYLFIPLGVSLALFFASKKSQLQEATAASTNFLSRLISKLTGPWLLPLIILQFIVFFLTLSRGAFIALVPFTLLFAIFYFRQIFSFRNIVLGLLVVVISLTAVFKILDSVSYDAIDTFLAHAGLEDVLVTKTGESGIGRLNAFAQAVEFWEESPAVGIGLGNFGPAVLSYPLVKPEKGWDIVNNEYLELLAETGVLGLAAFALILIVVFLRSLTAYRNAKDEYLRAVLVGLTIALVAILTQYNFFSTLYIIHIWVLLGLIVATQNLILTPKKLPS